jgi:hypothetical protein
MNQQYDYLSMFLKPLPKEGYRHQERVVGQVERQQNAA